MTNPSNANGLNFDENDLIVLRHPITISGHSWQIRDDYPTATGLQIYLLVTFPVTRRMQEAIKPLMARSASGDEPTLAEIQTAQERVIADFNAASAECVSALFTWSGYKDMTPKKVAETFAQPQLDRIVAYFFSLRMPRSSEPSPSGTTTSQPTSPSSETPTN